MIWSHCRRTLSRFGMGRTRTTFGDNISLKERRCRKLSTDGIGGGVVCIGKQCIRLECCVTKDIISASSRSDGIQLSLALWRWPPSTSASPVNLPDDDIIARLLWPSVPRDWEQFKTSTSLKGEMTLCSDGPLISLKLRHCSDPASCARQSTTATTRHASLSSYIHNHECMTCITLYYMTVHRSTRYEVTTASDSNTRPTVRKSHDAHGWFYY